MDTGWTLPLLLPLPPPWAWSAAFMARPRTVGRMFRCLLRPALPSCLKCQKGLLAVPIVPQASALTLRISPLCNRTVTSLTLPPNSFFAITVACVPALRQNTAPLLVVLPTQYTDVPSGTIFIGKQLPRKAVFAASIPGSTTPPMLASSSRGIPERKDSTVSPARIPSAAMM